MPIEHLRSAVLADPQLALSMLTVAMDLVLQKDLRVILGKKQTTELRRSIDLERETTRMLKERDQLKSERVAMMAHDIRSPVSVVIGCAELLTNRWNQMEESQRAKFLDTISRQARGLLDLVDDALQVASIEAGELKYAAAPFDMALFIDRMVSDMCKADEGLNLTADLAEDLPQAMGDEHRYRQVLFNLLSNAMKFSDRGDPIRVSAIADGDEIVIAVQDKGVGIPAEEIDRVFQKFARVEGPSASKAEGTGLGLYICKLMVEAQGGRIWIESEPGAGSRFSFTVPVAST
jgi:signal transduction histidine kinase